MKFDLILLLGLSFGVSIDAYQPVYNNIQRRACAKNNLYRTLERLQRESAFCQALLAPNPTVTIPSGITATPAAAISSACNCIVATVTRSTTTTTTSRPITTSTTSASVCANTVTLTLDPVTVTKTLDPVTVTETYTPTTLPTSVATAHFIDFEKPSRLWGCSSRISYRTQSDSEFVGCAEHEDPGIAHSGNWFFRVVVYPGSAGETQIFRFGNLKGLAVLPNTDYEFSYWHRQYSLDQPACTLQVDLGNVGLPAIGGNGLVNSGFFVAVSRPATSLTWARASTMFNSRGHTEVGMFFLVECKCTPGSRCDTVYFGVDDITLKPVA